MAAHSAPFNGYFSVSIWAFAFQALDHTFFEKSKLFMPLSNLITEMAPNAKFSHFASTPPPKVFPDFYNIPPQNESFNRLNVYFMHKLRALIYGLSAVG